MKNIILIIYLFLQFVSFGQVEFSLSKEIESNFNKKELTKLTEDFLEPRLAKNELKVISNIIDDQNTILLKGKFNKSFKCNNDDVNWIWIFDVKISNKDKISKIEINNLRCYNKVVRSCDCLDINDEFIEDEHSDILIEIIVDLETIIWEFEQKLN